MFPEIRNHSYSQQLKDLDLISIVQRRFWGQLIEVFKFLKGFIITCAPIMTSITEQGTIQKSTCRKYQHFCCSTFLHNLSNNNMECFTKLSGKQENGELFQEPPQTTYLGLHRVTWLELHREVPCRRKTCLKRITLPKGYSIQCYKVTMTTKVPLCFFWATYVFYKFDKMNSWINIFLWVRFAICDDKISKSEHTQSRSRTTVCIVTS